MCVLNFSILLHEGSNFCGIAGRKKIQYKIETAEKSKITSINFSTLKNCGEKKNEEKVYLQKERIKSPTKALTAQIHKKGKFIQN